ncbi:MULTISPECIES: class II fructose-bisphosphate aldolase [Candidatus Ichthyocystis]|uniref:Fructose-1,6-bisphosphate aldolase n=1 Tax=Candidatus Ichthyocystis hellenicum TaxID=1561003 RepID=A0A0S4M2I3_9BURK|nr:MULTISPECIES: class II fructose-bisphosphate aldolase [Ichthyocystis]CUT17440.1 Fructose-bisphosphate aldolase [Candidatus Ichthyocystis hellenicum]
MLLPMKVLLDHAAEYQYGIPAFNVNNLEQIHAIMRAAVKTNSPVILQASAGARKYAGEIFLKHLFESAIQAYRTIPIAIHQDHGQTPAVCMSAIRLGFSSVMMDGSLLEDGKTPSNYNYNISVTKKVVEFSHAVGVTVEGELGCLGSLETGTAGSEDGIGAEGIVSRDDLLTDPDQAADFVEKTNIDALAIAIGTSHGAYKFTRKPTNDILDIERVRAIHRSIPNTHLVMHGSSSVPQELLEEIRAFGGSIPETYGVPVEHIVAAIKDGVRKINIDTDIRLAMTARIRSILTKNPDVFDPRVYLKEAMAGAEKICCDRYEAFGCAGMADKVKYVSFEKVAASY